MVMDVSERRVCRVAGQRRSTQRRTAPPNPYRDKLVTRMRELAVANPRRGRRYVRELLRKERWSVGVRLMKRLWRQEGLLVPQKRVTRRRIGTGENGIVRRRTTRMNEVWGMDFVQDWTADGRPLRMLVVLDECTRECLAIEVARQLGSDDVLERLSWLMPTRGVPDHVRSDNGSEFTATAVAGVAWQGRGEHAVHRAGQPPPASRGERFRGEPERQVARRTPERRDLLHGGRGEGTDRMLARALQPGASAPCAQILPAGTRRDGCWTTLRFAPGRPEAASESDDYCVIC